MKYTQRHGTLSSIRAIAVVAAVVAVLGMAGCESGHGLANPGIRQSARADEEQQALVRAGGCEWSAPCNCADARPIANCYLEKLTPLRFGMTEEELRSAALSMFHVVWLTSSGSIGWGYTVTLKGDTRVWVEFKDGRAVRFRLFAHPDLRRFPVYPGQPHLLCNASSWNTPPTLRTGYAWIGVVCDGVEAAFRPGDTGVLPLRAEERVAWVDLVPRAEADDVPFEEIIAVIVPGRPLKETVTCNGPVVDAEFGLFVRGILSHDAYATRVKGIEVIFTCNEHGEVSTVSVRDPRVVLGHGVRVGMTYEAIKEVYPEALAVSGGPFLNARVRVEQAWAVFGRQLRDGPDLRDGDRVCVIEFNDYLLGGP
jgi:hypothetical protein